MCLLEHNQNNSDDRRVTWCVGLDMIRTTVTVGESLDVSGSKSPVIRFELIVYNRDVRVWRSVIRWEGLARVHLFIRDTSVLGVYVGGCGVGGGGWRGRRVRLVLLH